ncbi:MAG TPA: hypothetical protein VFJ05_06725 [Nitrososphaeraceae archaeon]|nr:hypothetical protein [Nitrososphaeraceae archaeon]
MSPRGLPLIPANISCIPLIASAIAVITKSSANPSLGYERTKIDKDVITMPVAKEEKSYDECNLCFRSNKTHASCYRDPPLV